MALAPFVPLFTHAKTVKPLGPFLGFYHFFSPVLWLYLTLWEPYTANDLNQPSDTIPAWNSTHLLLDRPDLTL